MKYSPYVSVIILNWNGGEMLRKCIESLLTSDYKALEIIVSDNGSTDGSDYFVEQHYPSVKLLRNNKNLGYSRGNNVAVNAAKGDIIIFSNNDIVVEKSTISKLVQVFEDPTIGIATGVLCYPKSLIVQNAGLFVHKSGYVIPLMVLENISQFASSGIIEVQAVQGAFMVVRKSLFNKIGLFDENLWAFYEDIDICIRTRQAGYRVVVRLDCIISHERSGSWNRSYKFQVEKVALREKGRLYFLIKHHDVRNVLLSLTWQELHFWIALASRLLQKKSETQLSRLRLQQTQHNNLSRSLARTFLIILLGKLKSLFYLPLAIKSCIAKDFTIGTKHLQTAVFEHK
jgi:GT2 family glycosyltransferase